MTSRIPIALLLCGLAMGALDVQASSHEAEETLFPDRMTCGGNEPSWYLKFDGDETEFMANIGIDPQPMSGSRQVKTFVRPQQMIWRGRNDTVDRDLVAFIRAAECSDTMSDKKLSYQVTVTTPKGEVMTGCCRILPPKPE